MTETPAAWRILYDLEQHAIVHAEEHHLVVHYESAYWPMCALSPLTEAKACGQPASHGDRDGEVYLCAGHNEAVGQGHGLLPIERETAKAALARRDRLSDVVEELNTALRITGHEAPPARVLNLAERIAADKLRALAAEHIVVLEEWEGQARARLFRPIYPADLTRAADALSAPDLPF